MLDRSAKGVFVIAPTPFLPDGSLDLASTDRMTDAFLAAGASGMTILGVMGEAPKLTEAESLTFVDRVLKRVAGRVPVVVGASAPGFAQMKAIARGSIDLGAAGIMVSPTPGLKGDEAVVSYIAQAVETVNAPFVLQDYPQLTGITMTAPMIARMAAGPARGDAEGGGLAGPRQADRGPRGWRPRARCRACRSWAASAGSSCRRNWRAAPMAS